MYNKYNKYWFSEWLKPQEKSKYPPPFLSLVPFIRNEEEWNREGTRSIGPHWPAGLLQGLPSTLYWYLDWENWRELSSYPLILWFRFFFQCCGFCQLWCDNLHTLNNWAACFLFWNLHTFSERCSRGLRWNDGWWGKSGGKHGWVEPSFYPWCQLQPMWHPSSPIHHQWQIHHKWTVSQYMK